MVKFLHAADIHLDSPLKGLERYDGAPVEEIRGATRQALANLVRLAIDEKVDLVLIAGDLYDGDWRDHRTGLFFVSEAAKLRDAGIPVCLIAGNHDAQNRMTRSLRLPDNVFRFSTTQPETRTFEELGISVHGQGFATAACTENLARAYPRPVPGHFNIGLLHTAADGSNRSHSTYAQCCYDDLRGKQYDYWALGHIHQRGKVWNDPRIHFSGNIQGRHIREDGAKGCLLVAVDDRHEVRVRFEPLDVLRWERCEIDAAGAEDGHCVVERAVGRLETSVANSDGRPVAARVVVSGACRAHETLAADANQWANEIRAAAQSLGHGSVWVEKVQLETTLPSDADALTVDDGPLAELVDLIGEIRGNDLLLEKFQGELADLARRLPGELLSAEDSLRFDDRERLRLVLDQVKPLLLARLGDKYAANLVAEKV